MTGFWVGTSLLFCTIVFLLAKLSLKYYEDETSEHLWKLWGIRTSYWEGIVVVSGLLTSLIVYILKLLNILTF